jgi:SAM-dependent methyltransferase
MTCCGRGYEEQFDDAQAAKDLRRFRRKGPSSATRTLINLLRARGVSGASLLDIGGGVGVIHHELLGAGASRAVHIDASLSYIRAAREEAERRGHANAVEFMHGDFVEMAPQPADVVTLDKVICCYPDMEQLVAASAARARRLWGAVFPRDRWFFAVAFRVINLFIRLRGRGIQIYLHSPEAIDAAVRQQGLDPDSSARTFMWQVSVYARKNG